MRDRGEATTGTITTPKELRVSSEGNLRPAYCPLVDQRTGSALIAQISSPQLEEVGSRFGTPGEWNVGAKQIVATSPKSWSVRLCGSEAENFLYTAEVSLKHGRAIGLLFKQLLAVLLDYQEQTIVFTQLTELQRLDSRRVSLEYGKSYRLRVIAKGEFFEVYLDDDLSLNFVRYQPSRGRFGLLYGRGRRYIH